MDITSKEIGIIVAVVVVIGALVYFAPVSVDNTGGTQTETKDTETNTNMSGGSSSGTQTTTNTPPVPTGFSLGQTVMDSGITITPASVIEDSRCPTGSGSHACIWEGKVRIAVRLRKDTYTNANTDDIEELTLGKPFTYGDQIITLTSVLPYPIINKSIRDNEYRFKWIVSPR